MVLLLVLGSGSLHFPFGCRIIYAGIRLVGFQCTGRNYYLVQQLAARVIETNPVAVQCIQFEVGVESATVRLSVCPEQGMLAGLHHGQYISLRDEVGNGVARLAAELQVTSCKVCASV